MPIILLWEFDRRRRFCIHTATWGRTLRLLSIIVTYTYDLYENYVPIVVVLD